MVVLVLVLECVWVLRLVRVLMLRLFVVVGLMGWGLRWPAGCRR
jgi:hypothetical protein